MNVRHLFIAAIGLISIAPTTPFADDQTYAQLGTWVCNLPYNHPAGPFTCPYVNFPSTFGDTPKVIISGCADGDPSPSVPPLCMGPLLEQPQNITPQGFNPVTKIAGFHGYQRLITGNWIAVGSRLFSGNVIPK